MPVHNLLASGFALAAAFLYATSNVIEHRVAATAPQHTSMRVGLLVHLAKRRTWWLGIASDVGGFASQVAALRFGSLVLVQPILVMSLLFSLTLGAAAGSHRLTRRDVLHSAGLVVSLGVFLAVAAPSGGLARRPFADWLLPGTVLLVLIGGCILLSRGTRGHLRAALLGAAAGACFGVSSTLMKSFSHLLSDEGIPRFLLHWEPYALGAVIASGFLMVQSAFLASDLRASLPALEVAEPVVAALLGAVFLQERLHATSAAARLAVALSLGAMCWTAIRLAEASAAGAAEVSAPSTSPTDLGPAGTAQH